MAFAPVLCAMRTRLNRWFALRISQPVTFMSIYRPGGGV